MIKKYGDFEGLLISSYSSSVGSLDATPFASLGEETVAGMGEKTESGHSVAVDLFGSLL
jgi:hypothetical protein